jgi:predicted nucleic acid-binding protein
VTDGILLLDNSAWVRLPLLAGERADEIATALESGRIATCLPFLLEAGYSARHARERDEIFTLLSALPRFPVDHEVEQRALTAQDQLAGGVAPSGAEGRPDGTRVGHHRLPPVYLLVAAVADRHPLGVLHYDRDDDLIAEKTDLAFSSVWLSLRGSL